MDPAHYLGSPYFEHWLTALATLLVEQGVLTREELDARAGGSFPVARPSQAPRWTAVASGDARSGFAVGDRVRVWEAHSRAHTRCPRYVRGKQELGFGGPEGEHMVVVENTPEIHNVVVCTLCSCYPWPVLGLPPNWYKSPPYRARMVREPRNVLSEMGVELSESVSVRVWDSSAEIRYLVLPERPQGTEGMSEQDLAKLVTRDSMIGVARP